MGTDRLSLMVPKTTGNRNFLDGNKGGLSLPAVPVYQRGSIEPPSPKNEMQAARLPGVIQRFIAIVGEEVPADSTTLQDGAVTLMTNLNEDDYYTENDIEKGLFEAPKADETIYLIAHGDNPAVALTKEAALGEKNGTEVKNIVKKILQKFTKDSNGVQFSGRIILEGCHTAEPVVDEDNKSKKGSMLYDFQEAMLNDKFFKDHMAPEATIGGYLGLAFSAGDYSTGYGTANTEHPLTIRYQKQRGVQGQPMQGGKSTSYDNTESFLESRWKQSLPFGVPDKQAKKGKKKK